jgi:adenylate cyclase class IV
MLHPALYNDFSVKALCTEPARVEETLLGLKATFAGADEQKDIYFKTAVGKLKLRQGRLENILIHYYRSSSEDKLMHTRVFQYLPNPGKEKIDMLYGTREVIGEFKKVRRTYVLENAKVHLDKTTTGESYVEIEVFDTTGTRELQELKKQCGQIMNLLYIKASDIVNDGYFNPEKQIG